MKIGIDIDDTALITVKSMIKYADKYDVEEVGGTGTNGNLGLIKDRYYLKVLYGWNDKTKFSFFNKYYKNVLEECVPMPDVADVIKKLKEDGHEIQFVTARLINIPDCDTETITKDTLEKYSIPYDKLVIHVNDKVKYCLENDIDMFIEDSFDTCQKLEDNGIKSYLMTTRMNENLIDPRVERINSWNELYNKIKNYK